MTDVVFCCPGTKDKPYHDCTREAVAALYAALEDEGTTVAVAGLETLVASSTNALEDLKAKLGEKKVRVQVACQTCSTLSILTDKLIRTAQPDTNVEIPLLLPTPGDGALAETAKSISGSDALKAATVNATFVLGNLTLITALVTTLGLAKTEEIGTKLLEKDKIIVLIAAGVAGMLSVGLALWAQLVTTGDLNTANLATVREFLRREINRRALLSRASLVLLGLSAALIASALLWTFYESQTNKPSGKLAVTINPATLTAGIETSWSNADKDSRLIVSVLTTSNVPILMQETDTEDGAAEVKTSFAIPRSSDAADETVTVASQLVNADGSAVADASKRQCISIASSGAIALTPCSEDAVSSSASDFGGPYHLIYESAEVKKEDFARYKSGKLGYSEAAELKGNLLRDSIVQNMKALPDYKTRQLYNYAIDTTGHVFVAVWHDTKQINFGSCPGGGGLRLVPTDGTMIDWFPEDPRPEGSAVRDSPCWLKVGSSNPTPRPPSDGVLDALSKHFMLVHGVGASINSFPDDPTERDRWADAEVAYAGEIIVEVDDKTCTFKYSVNNSSGTYRPEDRRAIREKLVSYFTPRVGAPPASVNARLSNLNASASLGDRC